HFRLALDLARREALPEEITAACRGLGRVAEAGGRMAGAGKHLTDAVATARTHGLGVEAVEDDLALARTRYYREPMAEVLDHARAIVDTAARMGHHAVEMEAHLLCCMALYDLARREAVLEHAERASDITTRLGTARAEGAIASFAARALAALD